MTEQDGFRLRNRGTWTGGAWLLTTIALGLALVAASWANYRGARSAYDTYNRGQIELLQHSLRQALGPGGEEGDSAVLAEALATHAGTGLRYIAFVESDGTITLEAGTPVAPVIVPTSFFESARETGIVMERVEDRVRAFLPRGRGGGPGRGGGGNGGGNGGGVGNGGAGDRRGNANRDAGSPDTLVGNRVAAGRIGPLGAGTGARGDTATSPASVVAGGNALAQAAGALAGTGPGGFRSGGPFMPASTLIEFEPIEANQLMTRAGRSLGLGSFVAALLTLAAILFWRQTSRYEEERRQFEQRRRLSQLGEMSAVMAHEIRNPLASLKGNAQLLAEKLAAGTKEKSKADRIVAEATRLEALTTDLLEFARSGPIELTATDPSDVLQAAVSEVGSNGFDLETDEAPKEWNLDPKRLRYALVNVLQNALQASPSRAPHIRVSQESDKLVYEVRDFGPGLSPGTEARLFDPFFTTRTNGTGLGLAVALRAAEFHGGTITASNHPDGGAVFRIVLPPSSN